MAGLPVNAGAATREGGPAAPAALRALLAGIVDYAGLYPPAALPLERVVAEYAAYRAGPDRWLLGRLVVGEGHLGALGALLTARADLAAAPGDPWPLSVLPQGDPDASRAALEAFSAGAAGRARVASVEVKAARPDDVARAVRAAPAGAEVYVEVPYRRPGGAVPPADAADDDLLAALLDAVAAARADRVAARAGGLDVRAKARTGGVTPAAIPAAGDVARFLVGCAARGLPLKLTAGLHHPLRAEHALTYAPDAPRARMLGFVGAFLAAALAHAGERDPAALEAALDLSGPAELSLDEADLAGDALRWRPTGRAPRRLAAGDLARARADFAASFGSCSFTEPTADLRALGWLAGPA